VSYGYWVDMSKKFFDPAATSWIHALPVGEYEHPVYGKMSFTPDRIQKFANSVKGKVRGIDPDIDYDHKDKTTKAAGWVKGADARNDGLYLQVDWTEPAAKAIKAGEYRYFSPEFDDWTDAQGVKHTDVVFGGALTNRPFLKDLLPVNLSEITNQQPQGGTLDLKQLRAALKLSETASDDEVLSAISKLATPAGPTPTPNEPPTPAPVALDETVLTKMLAELPAFKALEASVTEAQKKLAEAESARQLAETKHRLSSLHARQGGRDYVLPPSVIDEIAAGTVASDPVKMSEAFLKGLEQFVSTGMVELGERGRASRNPTEKDAGTQLSEAVLAAQATHLQTTGKQLSYASAVQAVVRQSPELYQEYRQDSYAEVVDR
jgi:hypothetical protein